MLEIRGPQRFSPTDTISIDMEIHNEAGVDSVYAAFVHTEDPKNTIGLYGNGEGRPRPRIDLQARTAADPAPGEYLCRYVHVSDVDGNYAVSYPDGKIHLWVGGSADA